MQESSERGNFLPYLSHFKSTFQSKEVVNPTTPSSHFDESFNTIKVKGLKKKESGECIMDHPLVSYLLSLPNIPAHSCVLNHIFLFVFFVQGLNSRLGAGKHSAT
jgi:hypothetical protein